MCEDTADTYATRLPEDVRHLAEDIIYSVLFRDMFSINYRDFINIRGRVLT
jgi:hypothetical protein